MGMCCKNMIKKSDKKLYTLNFIRFIFNIKINWWEWKGAVSQRSAKRWVNMCMIQSFHSYGKACLHLSTYPALAAQYSSLFDSHSLWLRCSSEYLQELFMSYIFKWATKWATSQWSFPRSSPSNIDDSRTNKNFQHSPPRGFLLWAL